MTQRFQSKLYSVTKSATGTSDWITLDHGPNTHIYTIAVRITGTATCDVELTTQDPATATTFIQHPELNGISATAGDIWESPVQGVRLNISSYSSGAVTLYVLESD